VPWRRRFEQMAQSAVARSTAAAPTERKRRREWVPVAEKLVPSNLEHARAHEVALHLLEYGSRTAAKKACRRGEVFVDGSPARTDQTVSAGQCVQLRMRPGGSADHRSSAAAHRQLEVVAEDDCLVTAVKPQGMAMASGDGSFHSLIAASAQPSPRLGSLHKPMPVHRLDIPTGGIILCGKTKPALQSLSIAFSERRVAKEYFAIVEGEMEHGTGVVDMHVGEKEAQTEFTVLSAHEGLSQLVLRPITGRTHQLRLHMSSIGHPVLNDERYGSRKRRKRRKSERNLQNSDPKREHETDREASAAGESVGDKPMMLWAMTLSVPHPDTGDPLTITRGPPLSFNAVWYPH